MNHVCSYCGTDIGKKSEPVTTPGWYRAERGSVEFCWRNGFPAELKAECDACSGLSDLIEEVSRGDYESTLVDSGEPRDRRALQRLTDIEKGHERKTIDRAIALDQIRVGHDGRVQLWSQDRTDASF